MKHQTNPMRYVPVPTLLSNCHKVPVSVRGGGEGTSYYVCGTCHKPCDFHVVDTKKPTRDEPMVGATEDSVPEEATPEVEGGDDELNKALDLITIKISFQSNTRPEFSITLSEAATAIRAAIRDGIPEKVHYNDETVPKYLKPRAGETWEHALRHEQGFNAVVDQITTELKRKGLL